MPNSGLPKIFWKNETRDISTLKPAKYNPRFWSDKARQDLKNSLQKFSLADPIVINTDDTIIGGHFRIEMLKEKGISEVDVRVPSRKLTKVEEKELNLRLNKNLGDWNFEGLAGFDEDLLKDVGFDSEDLDKIFKEDDKPEDDDIPEDAPAITKPGDIYQLGRHKIMSGDSTKREDVEKLMDGKKADMVFTDPPYGVSYDGGHATDKRREKLKGDESVALYEPTSKMAFEFSKENVAFYLFHAGVKGFQAAAAAAGAGWEIRSELIWNKNVAQFGAIGAQYKQKHEPFYYCFKQGKSPKWCGQKNEVTVWGCDRKSKNEFHPTQKPVELGERAIGNSSERDDIVLDLFLGSGSTLIACEKTNRICYGMELDPKYCDVIVKRWEDYTGKKAEKTGEPVATN